MTVTDLHPDPPDGPEPTMADLHAWVTERFGGIVERRVSNTRRWCGRWWEHPDAVERLWLLFHAHREVVAHGSARDMAAWVIDQQDRMIDALMNAGGPFSACAPSRHSQARHMPLEPAPGAWAEGGRP